MIGQQLSEHRDCRLFVSDDLDDTRARISAVMQPHELHPVGRPRDVQARMSFLRLPGLGVGTIKFGQMALRLDRVEDYHLLIFCIDGHARVRTRAGERTIGGARGICLAPGEPVRAHFSEECEQLVVRIDAATMRRMSRTSSPVLQADIDLGRAALRPWLNLANLMTNDVAMIDMLRRDERIGADYAQLFVGALLDAQGVTGGRDRAGIAPVAVKRAEAYIEEHFALPLTLDDIAGAAGVPVRTLLHGFQRFRGVSPMRHLRDRRLDHAKARLSGGEPALTVAEVATEAGFAHLGRFSQDYRARFGEPPSMSLKRSHRARSRH